MKVRHLAATQVGRTVSAISRVIEIDTKSVPVRGRGLDGNRKIGDGTIAMASSMWCSSRSGSVQSSCRELD